MARKLGVVMDPIQSITPHKDTTLALMLEAQSRDWEIRYMELADLRLRDGQAMATHRGLTVRDDNKDWFELGNPTDGPLSDLDVVLMRKDPPFDTEYIYATYLLEMAEAAGSLVVNKPSSLRDANEKIFAQAFPQCCTPTLVARDMDALREFVQEQGDAVVKPLDGMGGASIFKVSANDSNLSVILETLTEHGQRYAMAQRFVPEISAGDKRILMINGEPVPYALARIPAAGENRGNLAAGGRGEGVELSERDRWICAEVGPTLREKGLLFVGLDVIGDYLTEINVTSPTCLRELDSIYGLNIAGQLFDCIDARLSTASTGIQ